MHVAFDVRTIQAGYGGDRIYLENLIRHLDRLPEIAALSLYTEPRLGDRIPLPEYPKVRRQALAASRGWLWTPLAAPRQLRRDAASIFHAPHLVPPFPPCPTVVTIHDAIQLVFAECDRSSPRARLDRALRGLSARRAAAIITDSEHSRGDLARLMHVPAEKIHVIPLAAAEHFTPGDRAEARASLVVDPACFTACDLGREVPPLPRADLAVCRAGALTIAELAAAGVPAVLVPFPAAVDDHQTRNAEHVVRGGAAVLLPESQLTPVSLAAALRGLLEAGRPRLAGMAAAARGMAITDADQRLADACVAAAGGAR